VAGDGAVERGPGGGEWGRHRRAATRAHDPVAGDSDGARQQLQHFQWSKDDVPQAFCRQSHIAGGTQRLVVLVRLGPGGVGLDAAQGRHQVGTADAVDAGVVHLRHHGDLAVGQALDHPELPQRALAVQWLPGNVGARLGELLAIAGRGHGSAVQVAVDVEVRVVDPHGVIHVEGGVVQLPAKSRSRPGAQEQLVFQLVEGVTAWDGRRVEHQQTAYVQQLGGRLEVEKAGVETAETFHPQDISR